MEGMTPASRQAPLSGALGHPVFVVALAVLVLNDQLLKGAGVVPGWLTGKLSDLAGMIVAPVLAAVVLRAHGPRMRVLAFGLVAAPFAVTEMSDSAARALESLVAVVGIEWRLWADPTDLVGLVALPLAWWTLDARRPIGAALRATALVTGAFASMATSRPPPPADWFTPAYVGNRTGAPVDVRVRWVDAEIDCRDIAAIATRALGPEAFSTGGVTITLADRQTIPLERNAAAGAVTDVMFETGPMRPCDAALISAEGMPDTVVFWQNSDFRNIPMSMPAGFDPRIGAVDLTRGEGATIAVELTVGLAGGDLDRTLDASACVSGTASAYQWSDLPDGSYRVLVVEPGADGCVGVDYEPAAGGDPIRAYVCIPADMFPFVAGDEVVLSSLPGWGGELRINGVSAELGVWSQTVRIDAMDASAQIVDLECEGRRRDCGAYVVPGGLTTDIGGRGTLLVPGDRATLGADERGWGGEIALGQSGRVIVGVETCDLEDSVVGAGGDVAIVRREVR